MNSIVRGFKSLTDFNGRDRRGQFWPYAGVVVGVWFVLLNTIASLTMVLAIAEGDDAGFLTGFFVTMIVGMLALAGLLAAAASRRLHDRGHKGLWALVPVAFFMVSIIAFWIVSTAFVTMDGVDEAALGAGFIVGFLTMLISNLIYMGSLVTLVIFLCLKGKTGPNQYGPEPV